MTNGLSNLFQNKLFLQYLAGAGQDIASGEAIGTNVNAITQKAIAAQNYPKQQAYYLKLLSEMLRGKVPEGGKVVTDSKGVKIDVPASALNQVMQGTQPGGVWEGLAPPLGAEKAVENIQSQQEVSAINPFRLASRT